MALVLYGCEGCPVMLRKECMLRVSENRVLRKMYRPEMDEIIEDWKKLHYEKLHDLYSSPNVIRVIK